MVVRLARRPVEEVHVAVVQPREFLVVEHSPQPRQRHVGPGNDSLLMKVKIQFSKHAGLLTFKGDASKKTAYFMTSGKKVEGPKSKTKFQLQCHKNSYLKNLVFHCLETALPLSSL